MNSLLLVAIMSLFSNSLVLEVEPAKTYSQISVMGLVYCDVCSNNSFSMHSYFLQGAEVQIDCVFKAINPRTEERIAFSANRTTDKNGVYKLDIPSVDGVRCAEDTGVMSSCQTSPETYYLVWEIIRNTLGSRDSFTTNGHPFQSACLLG